MESMMESSNILDYVTRTSYHPIVIGRGKRQQLVKSEGRFCMAFRLEDNEKQLCYRVWKERIPDAFERFKLIDEKLSKIKLEYFSNFRYVPSALRMKCDGSTVPGIVMDWLEGKTLDTFLKEDWIQLSTVEKLTFIRDFYYMCYRLRINGISHGDLSCLNIIVTSSRKIRLVDYDSLFVTEMKQNYYQTTGGAPSFQHPERISPNKPLFASIDDDNFSEYVIALSLWIAYFEPSVVNTYDESNLLFTPIDFKGINGKERLENIKKSSGWEKANSFACQFKHIKVLLTGLESIGGTLFSVPSLFDYIPEATIISPHFYSLLCKDDTILPINIMASFCGKCGNKFGESNEILFCPKCGTKRESLNLAKI